jgi:hypothetical protein
MSGRDCAAQVVKKDRIVGWKSQISNETVAANVLFATATKCWLVGSNRF